MLDDQREIMIMNRTGSYENDEEVVVDMEGELISALEEIDRLRM
jgi:hypothetical protein